MAWLPNWIILSLTFVQSIRVPPNAHSIHLASCRPILAPVVVLFHYLTHSTNYPLWQKVCIWNIDNQWEKSLSFPLETPLGRRASFFQTVNYSIFRQRPSLCPHGGTTPPICAKNTQRGWVGTLELRRLFPLSVPTPTRKRAATNRIGIISVLV